MSSAQHSIQNLPKINERYSLLSNVSISYEAFSPSLIDSAILSRQY